MKITEYLKCLNIGWLLATAFLMYLFQELEASIKFWFYCMTLFPFVHYTYENIAKVKKEKNKYIELAKRRPFSKR